MEARLNSLAATQLAREPSEAFEVELSPMLLLDHPKIEALGNHLCEMIEEVTRSSTIVWSLLGTQMPSSYALWSGPFARRWVVRSYARICY